MRAGIAYNNVNAAKGFPDIVDEARDIGRLADVGDKALGVRGTDRGQGLVELGLVPSTNGNLAAFRREHLCDGQPDTAGTAAYKRDFATQSKLHVTLPEHIPVITAVDTHRAAGN